MSTSFGGVGVWFDSRIVRRSLLLGHEYRLMIAMHYIIAYGLRQCHIICIPIHSCEHGCNGTLNAFFVAHVQSKVLIYNLMLCERNVCHARFNRLAQNK